jgi:hypothetical protein
MFIVFRQCRHFGVGYIKLRYIFNPYAEQHRDKPFQQVGVLHEHHFEQYVVRQFIFEFRHGVIPLYPNIIYCARGESKKKNKIFKFFCMAQGL